MATKAERSKRSFATRLNFPSVTYGSGKDESEQAQRGGCDCEWQCSNNNIDRAARQVDVSYGPECIMQVESEQVKGDAARF